MCKGVENYEENIRACWILESEKVSGKLSYQKETGTFPECGQGIWQGLGQPGTGY